MENQNTSEDKRVRRNLIWAFASVVLFAAFAYSGLIWAIVQDKKDLAQSNERLLKEQKLNTTCSYNRDSLNKEVANLSIYKSLTKAMVHRDEATKLMKYKVGDFVYMKRDSSKVVVSDIVIGGAKYEYYIRYKVLYKDQSTEEVIPELLY